MCLLIVPNLIVQIASFVYRKLAQFASISDKRAAIIGLHRESKTNSEIIKLLKAPKLNVYYTVNRFKKMNSTEDRPRSDRPRTSRTPNVINAVRATIRHNPRRSMGKMARKMDVSEMVMRNIVKTDLKSPPSNCKLATSQKPPKRKGICSGKNSSEQNEVRYGHRRDNFLRWKSVQCRNSV